MQSAGKQGVVPTLRRRLLSGGVWALGGKVFAAISALIVNAVLSRLLSPDDYGAYFIAISVITFAATFGTFGTDLTVVRVIAEAVGVKRFGRVKQSTRIILFLGILTSLLTVLLYALFHTPIMVGLYSSPVLGAATLGIALWIGVAVFQRLLAEVFRGFHNIRLSTLVSGIGTRGGGILMGVLQPLGIITLAVLGFATLYNVLLVSALVSFMIVVIGGLALGRILQRLPEDSEALPTPSETLQKIFLISGPLFVATLMLAVRIQSDILILGAFGSKDEVALYGSALRLVSLVVTPLLIMNAVLPPIIAELYAQKKLEQLERLLRAVSTLVGLPSLLVLVVLSLAGTPILGLVYGDFYRQGAVVLVILSVGQLLNVLAGSCSLVLSMTGHQQVNMVVMLITATVAVVSGILLTQAYGMVGTAVSSALALGLQNILMVVIAKQKLGIWTHVNVSPSVVQDIRAFLKRGAR
jgi:O-antigen/teichoic acid export membrane protein